MHTPPATTSGLKSADGVISNRAGRLRGLQLLGDGTNAASVILYDNASAASGTVLAKINLGAGLSQASPNLPNNGIVVLNGIYADVSGTGAEFVVYFDKG